MPNNRVILVAESDWHGGNKLGLLNPETILESEQGTKYKPELTETQTYLWYDVREWGRKQIIDFADGSPIVVMVTGDVNQGMIYDVCDSLSAQVEIALMNLQPWIGAKNVIAIRIDQGTATHSFGYGDAESILAKRVQDRNPQLDVKKMTHGLSSIYGLTVDHAHAGPYTGSREWLKGNVAQLYLKDLMMKDILRNRKPPDLVLRGHYHSVVEVFNRICGKDGKAYRSWLWVLPSLCGLNGFALQVTRSEYEITNGIVAFEIIDGRIREAREFTKLLDLREVEVIDGRSKGKDLERDHSRGNGKNARKKRWGIHD